MKGKVFGVACLLIVGIGGLSAPVSMPGSDRPAPAPTAVSAEPEAPGQNAASGVGVGVSVPRLMKSSGVVTDTLGQPRTGVVGVTFALYAQQEGGAPLWLETQNVEADAEGRYTALLGAESSEGLPLEIFSSGEARWLGVQVQGEEERPRILLVSVPYALKSADADTLGGKPVSAFVQVESSTTTTDSPVGAQAGTSSGTEPLAQVAGSGTVGRLAKFITSTEVGDSGLFESGSGSIGLGTTTPTSGIALDVRLGDSPGIQARGASNPLLVAWSNTNDVITKIQAVGPNGFGLFGTESNHPLALYTNNQERMRLLSNGKVGIGTVPSTALDVRIGDSPAIQALGPVNPLLVAWSTTNNVIVKIQAVGADGLGLFGTETNHPLALYTGNIERMRITTSGNVGIGTSSPTSKLHASGSSSAQIILGVQNAPGIANPSVTNIPPSAIRGEATATSLSAVGVLGISNSPGGGVGVVGINLATGEAPEFNGVGVLGLSESTNGVGVSAEAEALTGQTTGLNAIVRSASGTAGVFENAAGGMLIRAGTGGGGQKFSVDGSGNGSFSGNLSVSGTINGGSGSSGVAGNFNVAGTLTKGSGTFKIDHPLEPERKYLYHSFVESPEMKNVYDGVAVLNEAGEAAVELPEYFEALNRDFRYQLTCVGGFAPVFIAEEIRDNRFKIAGGRPGLKVSWQVTGIRRDAYANAHPIRVEEDKAPEEQGYYLHPEAFGLPPEKGISAPHRRAQEVRESSASAGGSSR